MNHRDAIEMLGTVIEGAGVLLIAAGLLLAAWRARQPRARYTRAREDLGRAILLGLEVLVAADIVRTVAFEPTLAGLSLLALIVAIRTFLSWSLALELDGRWPWQRRACTTQGD
jgi:uncharacterized membrane protein